MKSFEEYSNGLANEARLYDILGVATDATDEEIGSAYKRAIATASGEHARDIKYAYKILKADRAGYDMAGDERWFGDKRHRAIRTPDARENSAARNHRQMSNFLLMSGWSVTGQGVHAGVPWVMASHPRDPERDYLFKYDNKVTTVLSGGKADGLKPDGGGVNEEVPLFGKRGIDGFKTAVKNLTGRLDSKNFVTRRAEQGKFTPLP